MDPHAPSDTLSASPWKLQLSGAKELRRIGLDANRPPPLVVLPPVATDDAAVMPRFMRGTKSSSAANGSKAKIKTSSSFQLVSSSKTKVTSTKRFKAAAAAARRHAQQPSLPSQKASSAAARVPRAVIANAGARLACNHRRAQQRLLELRPEPLSPQSAVSSSTFGPSVNQDSLEDEQEAKRTDLWPEPPPRWHPKTREEIKRLQLTPTREAWLRSQIIDLAASFQGVPYFGKDSEFADEHSTATAQQYYRDNPDSQASLDCCGLVRAVLWELHWRREAAFKIRRFNQNYQRRSLLGPASVISDVKQAQPGDLVFYLARSFKDAVGIKSTQLCRHVEILVGDGTAATWGSRWGDVVRRHDHYAFESTRWEIISIEFRSIKAWLEGPP